MSGSIASDPSGAFVNFVSSDGSTYQLKPIGGAVLVTQAPVVAAPAALTSSQNATAAAVDLATSEALANALKVSYNALQVDVAALRATQVALLVSLKTAATSPMAQA